MNLNAMLPPLLLVVLAVAYLDWRIRREARHLNRQAVRRSAALYDQLASLAGLYRELDPEHPLPASRGWAASPDFLLRVRERVRARQPAVVVECGSGISTVVTALTLRELGGGHVYSLEHSPEHACATRAELERHGVAGYATVIDSPLVEHVIEGRTWRWYATSGVPDVAIDLLVIDGPPKRTGKLARWPAGPLLFPRLSADAMVLLDDAARPDEVEAVRRWSAAHGMTARELWCEKGCVELTYSTRS